MTYRLRERADGQAIEHEDRCVGMGLLVPSGAKRECAQRSYLSDRTQPRSAIFVGLAIVSDEETGFDN